MRELLGFVGGVAFTLFSIVLTAKTAQPITTTHTVQASGETAINNQVAITWVRVADKTVIYLAHATAKDAKFVEIVADEKSLSVTPDKRIGVAGNHP